MPSSWTAYEIDTQASASMPIQRSYRLPHQSPIEAVLIDCGVYLFLMTLCIKNGDHLGMLTTTVVHAALPYLAWSKWIAATPLNLGYMVRANISTVSVTCAVDSALCAAPTPIQRYSLRARKRRMSDPDSGPATTRMHVSFQTNDPASMYTYAATSTLPGAGRGLYASRLIGPSSPLGDGKYVGEYAGGERMTEANSYKCMLDPARTGKQDT